MKEIFKLCMNMVNGSSLVYYGESQKEIQAVIKNQDHEGCNWSVIFIEETDITKFVENKM